MWGTTDADYGVTNGGCIADIDSTSTYSHADPSAGLYVAPSDRNNSCSNQGSSYKNTGTSAYRASCGAYRRHDGGRSGGCSFHHSH